MDDEGGIYIVVKGPDGGEIYRQRYDEYLANPNLNILSYRYGNELFDILFSMGKIRLNTDNNNNKEFVGTWLVTTPPFCFSNAANRKGCRGCYCKKV